MVHQENVGTRGSKTGPLLVHHQRIVEARRRGGVGEASAKGEVGPLVHQEILEARRRGQAQEGNSAGESTTECTESEFCPHVISLKSSSTAFLAKLF